MKTCEKAYGPSFAKKGVIALAQPNIKITSSILHNFANCTPVFCVLLTFKEDEGDLKLMENFFISPGEPNRKKYFSSMYKSVYNFTFNHYQQ